ncbi:MAG: thioredoxin domain-containing protein [Phycisphaerales bacterium]
MQEPKHTNRLASESSPYLLQHAHNPVDWYPWGEDAFALARQRGVPIFLSVGYSTCYWCHVMERESFESEAVAAIMNERYVCIKVDREERPDVDELSMAATVTFTGRGGWPTSVFLEPGSLRPFFAGTYFPPEDKHGLPSFTRVLIALSDAWTDQRDEIMEQAKTLADAVTEQLGNAPDPVPLGERHVQQAVASLLQIFDRADGGFGGAPKFPQPIFAEFLLDVRERTDDETKDAIDTAIRTTLDQMATGGINDQIAGGFHRYSVDKHWTVPHFEKMLYDNGQLAALYARAGTIYNDEFYRGVAKRTCDYVLREMISDPSNPGASGFYSAQDAEVDHREGLNYLWSPEQFDRLLSSQDAELAKRIYNLDASANFQDPHHPDDDPAWVLRMDARPEVMAARLEMTAEDFQLAMGRINSLLLAERMKRKQPGTDDKVLVSWNALMIQGLAETGRSLGQEGQLYIESARRAARFILTSMRQSDGRLWRTSRLGTAGIDAPLEDYAFMIRALLVLVDAEPAAREEWLEAANELYNIAVERFGSVGGVFFDTPEDRTDLFVRSRSTHDGATPAAVGVLLASQLEMFRQTGEDRWIASAVDTLNALSGAVDQAPVGTLNPVRALLAMMVMRDQVGERYEFASGHAPAPVQSKPESPVLVLANTEKVEVIPGTPAVFRVAIEIRNGYHIVASDPGRAGLPVIPLRVGLTRGSGVAVYADYPDGESFGVEGVGEINVHHGRIEFDVVLEHKPGVGASPGTPVLGVSYQACTDTECESPRTVELEIAVEVKDG